MGYWIAMAVNPNPVTDTADRQWAALNQAGMIMTSHGIAVPTDTPNQPNRGYASGSPGNFTVPRFGWPAAYLPGYVADVARDIVVTDWTPDDLSGYAMDSYGSLWPFGQKTPVAATGIGGAPFGIFPLGPGVTVFNGFQMHSGNGKPFGLGGFADGFGWMISADGIIVNWLGPIADLAQPWQNLGGVGLSGDGVLRGGQRDCVRDFKVNPDGSGDYYVLMQSGYVFNGGPPNRVVVAGDQPSPANVAMDTPNGFRWMHVEWGKWIIAFRSNGDPWGYNITGTTETVPPLPFSGSPPHAPWYNATGGPPPGTEGFWQDGELIPARGPTHLWMNASTGLVGNQVITGTVPGVGQALMIIGFVAGQGPTASTRPTLNWNWSSQYAVPQKSYSVRVYPQSYITAQGGAFVAGQNAGAIHINDREVAVASGATGTDQISHDLLDGTTYVAYVQVTSAAGAQTTWHTLTFTESITPAVLAPTSVTATPHPAAPFTPPLGYLLGKVTIATSGALGPGELYEYSFSAEGGGWQAVTGFEATTQATVDHTIAPTNIGLTYRVRKFKRVPGKIAGPWTLSNATLLTAQAGMPDGWRFIDPLSLGGPANPLVVPLDIVPGSYHHERRRPWSETDAISAPFTHVESAGEKGGVFTMQLFTTDAAGWKALWGILGIERSIIFMTIFGELYWVRAVPGTWTPMHAQPLATETTGIRKAHTIDLRMVETGSELA